MATSQHPLRSRVFGDQIVPPQDLYTVLPFLTKYLLLLKPAGADVVAAIKAYFEQLATARKSAQDSTLELFVESQMKLLLSKNRDEKQIEDELLNWKPMEPQQLAEIKDVLRNYSREVIRFRIEDNLLDFSQQYFDRLLAGEAELIQFLDEQAQMAAKKAAEIKAAAAAAAAMTLSVSAGHSRQPSSGKLGLPRGSARPRTPAQRSSISAMPTVTEAKESGSLKERKRTPSVSTNPSGGGSSGSGAGSSSSKEGGSSKESSSKEKEGGERSSKSKSSSSSKRSAVSRKSKRPVSRTSSDDPQGANAAGGAGAGAGEEPASPTGAQEGSASAAASAASSPTNAGAAAGAESSAPTTASAEGSVDGGESAGAGAGMSVTVTPSEEIAPQNS